MLTPSSLGHPLDGVRLKLIRAQEHFDLISSILGDFVNTECQIVAQRDSDTDITSLILHLPTPPLRVSLIVGDCLYNLRSALDHLVYQLVLKNQSVPTTANMLPICNSPDGYIRQLKRGRLDGVSAKAKAVIESLQPYKSGNKTLWLLSALANVDKHQTVALTVASADQIQAIAVDQESDFPTDQSWSNPPK